MREARREERQKWELTFVRDPIDLRALPRNVALRARQLLQGLASHRNYREFYGKRLLHNREVIGCSVTRNDRLLC